MSVPQPPASLPPWGGLGDCPPVTVTVKKAESSPASHTNSPPSWGWAAGSTRRRRGPSLSSTRASLSSTSSPSLYQRTWDPAGATSQRSSTRPGALNCRSRERAAGCTILSGGAGGRTEREVGGLGFYLTDHWLLSPLPLQSSSWEMVPPTIVGTYCVPGVMLRTLQFFSQLLLTLPIAAFTL